jgi:hypothetical protein
MNKVKNIYKKNRILITMCDNEFINWAFNEAISGNGGTMQADRSILVYTCFGLRMRRLSTSVIVKILLVITG